MTLKENKKKIKLFEQSLLNQNNEIAIHKTKWLYDHELKFRNDLDSLLDSYTTNVAMPNMSALDDERFTTKRHYNKSTNVQIQSHIYEFVSNVELGMGLFISKFVSAI